MIGRNPLFVSVALRFIVYLFVFSIKNYGRIGSIRVIQTIITFSKLHIFPIFLVLIIELLNTGIEHVVDCIGLEHHELSGLAKDAGSAAVFIGNCMTVII